ncbi:hypothetical protein GCM10028791_09930 [Echinicola sediminis]
MMDVQIKSIILIICLCGNLISCENRTVEYSVQNGLVVGVQQVVLYKNGDFYLELGNGGTGGYYTISLDTVYLNYFNKLENWPCKPLITTEYFQTIPTAEHKKPIKIMRN